MSTRSFSNGSAGERDDFPKIVLDETLKLPLEATISAADDSMTGLVDRILAAKRACQESIAAELYAEIDVRAFRLYGLTPEEFALVHGTTR